MKCRQTWPEFCKGKPFDGRNYRGRRAQRSGIGPQLPVQGVDAAGFIALVPSLKSPDTDARVFSEGGERDLVLDVKSKDLPAFVASHLQAYVRVLSRAASAC